MEKYDQWKNENVLETLNRRQSINTEWLLAFYKSNRKFECFGRIVEPCLLSPSSGQKKYVCLRSPDRP